MLLEEGSGVRGGEQGRADVTRWFFCPLGRLQQRTGKVNSGQLFRCSCACESHLISKTYLQARRRSRKDRRRRFSSGQLSFSTISSGFKTHTGPLDGSWISMRRPSSWRSLTGIVF